MGKFIFRRINGRLIPIRIQSRDITGFAFNKTRRIEAKMKRGRVLGQLDATFVAGKNRVSVKDVQVTENARGKGIASELFGYLEKLAARAGKKFIRTSEILHPAQVKIRAKRKTTFIGDGFGKYEDQSRKITAKQAGKLVEARRKHRINVRATTLISKHLKKRKR